MGLQQAGGYCPTCRRPRLFARPRFEAGWGVLLALLSCGLFLPVWLVVGFRDDLRPFRCQACGRVPEKVKEAPPPRAPRVPLRGRLGALAAAVGRTYRGMPEWAAPVVWGLAAAAPVVGAALAARAFWH